MITKAEQRTDMRITHSERTAAMTCPRKGALAYEYGIRTDRDALPLRFGSAIHLGLDLYKKWLIKHSGEVITEESRKAAIEFIVSEVQDQYQAHKPQDCDFLWEWEMEQAQITATLSAYFWRYQEEDLTYILSEHAYKVPIINPETGKRLRIAEFAGMIDAIVSKDNRLGVMEHKTTSKDISAGSNYWKRLRIDSQISGYFLGAESLGHNVEFIQYDVIKKTGKKPKSIPILDEDKVKQIIDKGTGERVQNKNGSWKQSVGDKDTQELLARLETSQEYCDRIFEDMTNNPDDYFVRDEITRLETDILDYQYDLMASAKTIHENRKHQRWPKNTDNCERWGMCPYFDLCCSGWKGEGELPAGYQFTENIHQELSEE